MYGDRPNRIFVDGQPLGDFYAAGGLGMVPHWWDFGPDGTLSFLAQDDNSLKRCTITLRAETGIANFTGGASVLSGGN